MPDRLPRTPRELRDEVEALIRDDLVGPLGGEEELHEAPLDQYLLGLLAPRFGLGAPGTPSDAEEGAKPIAADVQPEEDLAAAGGGVDSGAEGRSEVRPAAVDQLIPSAFGITFALEEGCHGLAVSAAWGAYERSTSEEKQEADGRPAKVWRRRPRSGARTVAIGAGGETAAFAPNPEPPEVIVRRLIRGRGAHRLVSLFLVNGQAARRCMPNSSSSTAAGRSSARRTSPRARCPRTSRSGFSYAIPPSPGHSSGMCSG